MKLSALRNAHLSQTNNTPLVLGPGPNGYGSAPSGGQLPPQNDGRFVRSNGGQSNAGASSALAASQPPPNNLKGRRAANTFFPNGSTPQGMQNRNGIQQATGPGDQRSNEYALHETNRGIDPRTGMPLNSGVQQTDGQQQSPVQNTYGNPAQNGNPNNSAGSNSASQNQSPEAFEDAKRRAALAGMGGPEMMFNVPPINVPQVDGGNRLVPGTGSTWNGGQYPQTERMLPMDAAPHDLNSLMQAPSGEMTVQPNNMGMLNSPAGRSFSNPNLQQPLNPQIPLESPMGNQGMNYADQAYPSQRPDQSQSPEYRQTSGGASANSDPRYGVNSDLQQYGQTMQYNSAQQNSNAWNGTPTPSNGLPNQIQVGNPNQLMAPGWNSQQMTPRITPPPYSGRSAQEGNDQYAPPNETGSRGDYNMQNGNTDSSGSFSSGSISSEPAPIYSPGARVPAAYNSGSGSGTNSASSTSRASSPYGQGYNGPRITPGGR